MQMTNARPPRQVKRALEFASGDQARRPVRARLALLAPGTSAGRLPGFGASELTPLLLPSQSPLIQRAARLERLVLRVWALCWATWVLCILSTLLVD